MDLMAVVSFNLAFRQDTLNLVLCFHFLIFAKGLIKSCEMGQVNGRIHSSGSSPRGILL